MTTIIYTLEDEKRLTAELKDLVDKHPRSYFKTLKAPKHKYLLAYIDNKTPLLQDSFYAISTKVYWVLSGLTAFPTCQHCGKQIIFRNVTINRGYPIGCSPACVMSLTSVQNKIKTTCLDKYGVENPYQSEGVKRKIHATMLTKYGVEHPYQSDILQLKIRATCLKRYGVEHQAWSHDISLKKHKRYTYNCKTFDSAPELSLYIYLTDHNIDFEYQPDVEFWYYIAGKKHKYIPDFKIGADFIEIKGSQFLDKVTGQWINPFNSKLNAAYEAKRQCCIANNVKILYEPAYRQYLAYITEKYGKDYLKQFKHTQTLRRLDII